MTVPHLVRWSNESNYQSTHRGLQNNAYRSTYQSRHPTVLGLQNLRDEIKH